MSESGPRDDPFEIPEPPPRNGGGSEAPGPEGPGPGAPSDAATDAWRALRDGLGAAAATGHDGEMQCVELCPICRAADVLRASGPPELRGQLNEFQREALMTLRALLDHYIERIDKAAEPAERVEDIPIS
jgi:hypothetical protein